MSKLSEQKMSNKESVIAAFGILFVIIFLIVYAYGIYDIIVNNERLEQTDTFNMNCQQLKEHLIKEDYWGVSEDKLIQIMEIKDCKLGGYE